MDALNKIGIYCIKNTINNKIYIGKSKNLKSRLNTHISELKNNKHHSYHLQRSFNKYGIDKFEYSILEHCKEENLKILEDQYIKFYNSIDRKFGYNIMNSEEFNINQINLAKIRNLKFGNIQKAILQASKNRMKEVFVFNLTGDFHKKYNSIKEASLDLKIDSSSIVKCCKNKIRYFKNFVFSYNNIFNPKLKDYKNKILVFNKKDNIEEVFNSIPEFCKIKNIKDPSVIHASIKLRNGNYKNFKINKYNGI